MKTTAITFAILSFLPSEPQPRQPWPRVELTGYVMQSGDLQLFGEGQKPLRFDRRLYDDYDRAERRLCFATQGDYAEAERLTGGLVQVRGIAVRHGPDEWFLVESVRLAGE